MTSGINPKIFIHGELCGIDVYRDDNNVTLLPVCRIKKIRVNWMQYFTDEKVS